MTDDRPTPTLRRAVPALASLDLEATCRFYAERLGFTPDARFPDYGIVSRDGIETHGPDGWSHRR